MSFRNNQDKFRKQKVESMHKEMEKSASRQYMIHLWLYEQHSQEFFNVFRCLS